MLAREDAFVLLVPGVVCSERMVVPWAMQALRGVRISAGFSIRKK